MNLIGKIITFGIWEASWFIAYLALSSPVNDVLGGINNSTTVGQVNQAVPGLMLVFNLCFILAMIAGLVYLAVAIHQREYEYERY